MKDPANRAAQTPPDLDQTWSSTPIEWPTNRGAPANDSSQLQPGRVLSGRYQIEALIGAGGMGAVYRARDGVLGRTIALKVIRAELSGRIDSLDRFKRELILARQVTHTNVIRIFDIGEAEGMYFITMEYVEGKDLHSILQEREKCSTDRAVAIAKQICAALEAAHAEGVVHRDLKPQNIIVEKSGKVKVMDFGIARSSELTGMTETGMLVGTPEYMSPEQAKGQVADARSDLFSIGIILYELLTGKSPYPAETPMASLFMRIQERPLPPIKLEPSIPKQLNRVVIRCLERDPAQRYQSAREILFDLDRKTFTRTSIHLVPAKDEPRFRRDWRSASEKLKLRVQSRGARLAIAGSLLLLFIAVAMVPIFMQRKAAINGQALKMLVADFDNTTSDPVFDRTLEPVFTTAMEAASFISSYNRNQARQLAAKLQPGSTALDEPRARLVSMREGINVIVSGDISKAGEGYKIKLKATDGQTGKVIATREADAANKDGVLDAITKVSAELRRALGDNTPESLQLAAAETFTTSSLEAAHNYGQGQEFQWAGKSDQAIASYKKAVELDPEMGRAYAGLAVMLVNQKKQAEAAEYYKQALGLLDKMSSRERYRTLGSYYLAFVHNYPKAIETYKQLVELYPADSAGWNNLSIAEVFTLNMPEAVRASKRALELNPANLQHRLNFALYSMYSGDFSTASAEAQRVLKQNPTYDFAFLPLALSDLARGNVSKARETYKRLEQTGDEGFSLAKLGEADIDLYLGRYSDAIPNLEAGIAADERQKNTGELAHKYVALAEAQLGLNRRAQALAAAKKAITLDESESVLVPSAMVFLSLGNESAARKIGNTLEAKLQSQTKAYAQLIYGEAAARNGKTAQAVEQFKASQAGHNSWMSHFLLGKSYVQAGHFPEGLAELEQCVNRRGETTDIFFADTSTLRYLPPTYYWLGRAQQALGMKSASHESFKTFSQMRGSNSQDPLLTELKARSF